MTAEPNLSVVLAAVPDMFFATRLTSIADRVGARLIVAKSAVEFAIDLARLHPAIVLVDLGARPFDPVALIRASKEAGVPEVIAFGPHKDLAARAAALDAGADQWVTNQRLAEVVAERLRPATVPAPPESP